MTEDFDTAWRQHRRRLLDLAYRMLGSVREAEDVVQEAYTRLLRADVDAIADVRGWLITVTGRLCLDQLRSARVTRAAYVGPWLPEPVVDLPGTSVDPADRVTLDDSVRMALLVVLQQLTPAERIAFLLHDVFAYPFDEIAAVTGRSISACRQLASRARRRVAAQHVLEPAGDRAAQQLVAQRFATACNTGNLDGLIAVLAADATGEFDSGGRIPGAPVDRVVGAAAIARTLLEAFAGTGAVFVDAAVNATPGIVVRIATRVVAVLSFDLVGERIRHVHAIGNRDKLAHIAL